ncbi:metalloregulator ArsR/SmtB family transcription factor [Granulosicoccus sp. 3-233]|uniref:metalloregulator ArsR/SmtB family transcription factor n=1 Tax=Granulosicoccus sp. 3-233 TaxID=3417969 RepID=UPI003D34DE3F
MTPTSVFKCLSDETRLLCLLLIRQEGELCVCELTASLALSQPKVSRHLAQLKSCNLVRDRKQGLWSFYRVHEDLPEWVLTVLDTTLSGNRSSLESCMENLRSMGERPERLACCD